MNEFDTHLEHCELCPRMCGVNRLAGERGFCKAGPDAVVYSAMAHRGEEPPLSGTGGSGTIFFSSCTMACVYCQNHLFSQTGEGRRVSVDELAGIMLSLQKQGTHNINLVTPTHFLPAIVAALAVARQKGLTVPVVYNTSGYERAEIIRLLDGIVDIYLPDMRYGREEQAVEYSQAPRYPRCNRESVREMHRQAGNLALDGRGIATRGLIIRHLVLPGNAASTELIMKFISEEISAETYISLMSQYHPYYRAAQLSALNRRITEEEYRAAQEVTEHYGLHNGWVQESGGLEALAGVHIKRARIQRAHTKGM
jgi:putative pyruvate formate lyase activating enzyme